MAVTTALKRRVTTALVAAGFKRGVDFRYSDEGKYAHAASSGGKYLYDTLALYPEVEGRYEYTHPERVLQTYALATALTKAGFRVWVHQNHGGDSGAVLVSTNDN
jgi:hypothetical protein